MQFLKQLIPTLLLFSFLIISCAEQKDDNKPLNPNGDTELALLMRAMFEEGEELKQSIMEDDNLKFSLKHEEMLTAEATEPEKAASNEYKIFAAGYLDIVNDMKSMEKAEAHKKYNVMVESCIQCHEAMCPGPLVRIQKLKIPKVKG